MYLFILFIYLSMYYLLVNSYAKADQIYFVSEQINESDCEPGVNAMIRRNTQGQKL